jgi:hypothetical protein
LNRRDEVIALVACLLLGGAATYALVGAGLSQRVTVTSVSTVTTTVTIDSAQEVTNAYLSYIQEVKTENITAIVDLYANNATVVYEVSNPTGGAGSGGDGTAQIIQLYNQDIFYGITSVNFGNESYSVPALGNGSEATIHANLTIYGNFNPSSAPGSHASVYVANLALSLQYVHVGQKWLISGETWNLVNDAFGCQSFSSSGCSIMLSSPNWAQQIWPQN